MTEVRAFLVGLLQRVYRPIEKLALEFWAERNVVVPSLESLDNSGPYKRSYSVYAPRILDLFLSDPEWRTLLMMKSSQSGLTLHVLIVVCRRLAEMVTSIIYVIDSLVKAKDISTNRLQPMLKLCKATKMDVEASEDDVNTLTYKLPRGIVRLAGAGSAGQVASHPADLVVGDELDKWKTTKGEAHPWLLLIQRIKQAESGKAIGFSSPTDETAITYKTYQTGSRHLYFVPCPECGHLQEINEERMRYGHCKHADGKTYDLRRVLKETYMECENPECKARIEEDQKEEMLMGGEWRPTNFDEIEVEGVKQLVPGWIPGEMSAHISDFYSMHPKSRWGNLMFEYIQALGDPKKMHDWRNGRAGLPNKKAISRVNARHVLKLRGKYDRGTLPLVPCIVTLHVDNQGDHQKYVILGWLPNGSAFVINWGKTLSLEEIHELVKTPIRTPDKDVFIQRVNIDEGGKDGTSYMVRTFCFPYFPMYSPCKGRGGLQVKNTITFSDSALDRGGQDKIPVCHFDDDAFKRLLYIERIQKFDGEKAETFNLARLWLPRNVDEELVRELCGEELVKELDDDGVVRFVWKQKPPNDYGDCIKMGFVMWNVIGHKFQDSKL